MSAAFLQRLIALAREHDPVAYAWLLDALADHRDGMALDQALGLAGPRAVRERDRALAEAATGMDPRGLLSTWARAGVLAERIESFEAVVWPRYRDDPTADSRGVNAALVAAFRSGARVPRTQRALHDVLKNPPADFRNAA